MTLRRAYLDDGAGGQLHFATVGIGPAVVLLHQTPRSWDEYAEVMQLCAGDLRLIAMDLPGMGASSSPRGTPSIEAYADAAIRLIEHLQLAPVAVCGHHTGGVVAMDIAARRPDLVRSLLLSSTPWVDAAARAERARKTPIDTVTRTRDGSHLADLWAQRSPYYPEHVQFMDRFMTSALQADGPEQGHHAVGRYEMEHRAPGIRCATLIVEHGSDPFATRHTAALQSALPQATFERIPDGGVPLEATADKFAPILRDWVLGSDRRHSEVAVRISP